MKKVLLLILFYSSTLLAQDSIVYRNKIVLGKIIDYSPNGILIKNSENNIISYRENCIRMAFGDSLVVYTRNGFPFKHAPIADTVFLKDGTYKLFIKLFKKEDTPSLSNDEYLLYYPIKHHGGDRTKIKISDIIKITNRQNIMRLNDNRTHILSKNKPNSYHTVYLKNGIVFKTDYCYFNRNKLAIADETISNQPFGVRKKDLGKIVFTDTSVIYFDTLIDQIVKKYPQNKYIESSKFYPYWSKKNFIGINLTNFIMSDLNISYYRNIFKNKADVGFGVNIPLASNPEVSNFSAYNNQYFNFKKNIECVISAEYYPNASEFSRKLSFGLVYRYTNFNYTFVDNSDGLYKDDRYKFIENRTNKSVNSFFVTAGWFLTIRKAFFFKTNLGPGVEVYQDPYQLYKGEEIKKISPALYTNFMIGIKF